MAGLESHSTTTNKPLVKHHLSQELILYFERVTASAQSEDQPELRAAALSSLREDPGLSQLLPYFVHYTADKVTHSLSQPFILDTTLQIINSLSHNTHLNLAPYISSLVPVVLTCLLTRHIGPETTTTTGSTSTAQIYHLRDFAATLLSHLCKKYAHNAHNLRPRLARSCLKTFHDPKKPLAAHYGAILGIAALGGAEVVRRLVVPSLRDYGDLLAEHLSSGSEAGDEREVDVQYVTRAIVQALTTLVEDDAGLQNGYAGAGVGESVVNGLVNGINGHAEEGHNGVNGTGDEELREKLSNKIGGFLATKILENGSEEGRRIARSVTEEDGLGGLGL